MKFDHGTSAAMSHTFDRHDERPASGTRDAKRTDEQRREKIDNPPRMSMGKDKTGFDISASKEFKLQELAMLSITPIVRSIHRWWLQRAERHYLICADVEQQRAREAQMNVAYYQKRAALARSARY